MAVDPGRQEIVDLLLRAHRDGRLAAQEEARLRTLMAHHNPSAPRLPWQDLYDAGLFMVGVWMQFEPATVRIEA